MEQFFPNGVWHYLVGGLLIGSGVGFLFVTTGLVGGMSTLYSAVWSFVSKQRFFQQPRFVDSRRWRLVYAAGLIGGAALWLLLSHSAPFVTALPWWQLLVGGFIAGFGARMANGCTSGHGICGLASLQLPSLLSVLTFLATAMIAAHVVRALGGA